MSSQLVSVPDVLVFCKAAAADGYNNGLSRAECDNQANLCLSSLRGRHVQSVREDKAVFETGLQRRPSADYSCRKIY